jgi:hypothetical protein
MYKVLDSIPVSSTIKTDRYDITEILLKVALNTITLTRVKPKNPLDFITECNIV